MKINFDLLEKISSDRIYPWLVFWISILSFGVMIPWLGIFGDEWTYVYAAKVGGYVGAVDSVFWDRPIFAYILALPATFFHQSFWWAHILILLARFADALLLTWFLQTLWPKERLLAQMAGLVFAIYPAFKQQLLPVEYFPHFVTLAFMLVSFTSMILAIRQPEKFWRWSAIAWLSSLNIFIIEYFFGQELLRPLIIWAALGSVEMPSILKKYKRAAIIWLPYLLVMMLYLPWKYFVVRFPKYAPVLLTDLQSNPMVALSRLIRRIGVDFLTIANGTWLQIFQLPDGTKTLLIYGLLLVVALIPCLVFLKNAKMPSDSGVIRWYILAGVWSIIVAGIPYWISGLPVALDFPWDRPALSSIIGVSLLTAGLIGLIRWKQELAIVLSILISFSVGLHFQNANLYRKEWDIFRQFYWQLVWRAPSLEPGTALVMDNLPFNYTVDSFMSFPVNLTYEPNPNYSLSYKVYDFNKLRERNLTSPLSGTSLDWGVGPIRYHSTTDYYLMMLYEPPACLHVFSPGDPKQKTMHEDFYSALQYSKPQLILSGEDQSARLQGLIGAEPKNSWCYFYEKAELARQQRQWNDLVGLAKTVRENKMQPGDPVEWLPFIEAYARTGDLTGAVELGKPLAQDELLRPILCGTWQRIIDDKTHPLAEPKQLSSIIEQQGCNAIVP